MNKIKSYNNCFFEPCLSLFKSNTPFFFDISEQVLFQNYLIKANINYYILFDLNKKVIASGGYAHETDGSIVLTWGMVHQAFHNKGYGTLLLEYRLNKIQSEFRGTSIILNTSQKTFKFYERFGFQVIKITNNYYGDGLDRYDMIKRSGPSRA